jgi:hypothetical protein
MLPLPALAGLIPLATCGKRRCCLSKLFASFTDQQLFEAVEILAMCDGYPEWKALLSRAEDETHVVTCARQFLATMS